MSSVQRYLIISLICFVPQVSEAAVTLSEVAWMGTAVSANDEWIELYNSGSEENVDGWVLSDGMNLSITLIGSIPGSHYAVLERTSDDTVSGPAFLVYTGALVNTGATLTLKRSDGSIVDQVAGGDNWENIGGDNVSKETAQYTSGGWVTAIATPGQINITETKIKEEEVSAEKEIFVGDEKSKDTSTTRNATPVVLKVVPSEPTVRINMPATVYVNQEVEAVAIVNNIGKTIEQSMERVWNFGDVTTAVGKEVTHRFMYPGEYIVAVRATYKDFEATDKVVVKVLPMNLSVTTNAAGDIQIHNDAKYEIDASGYQVRGEKTIVFPEDTYLRANATVTIPRSRLGVINRVVIVSDETGKPLVYFNPSDRQTTLPLVSSVDPVAAAESYPAVPLVVRPGISADDSFQFSIEPIIGSSSEPVVVGSAPVAPTQPPVGTALAAAPIKASPKQSAYPYLGLLGIIGVAVLAVVSSRRKTSEDVTESQPVTLIEDDPFPFR